MLIMILLQNKLGLNNAHIKLLLNRRMVCCLNTHGDHLTCF